MNMMVLGVISLLAGLVLMILGQLWAVVLFLLGFALMVAHWAKLFKGAGYQADISASNGLNGQGRQQSEVYKDSSIPREYEDRPGRS